MESAKVAVIIEDEPDIRLLLCDILEQAGFTVHTASNGAEGIELVRAHAPVVTTLDVSMPGMDGFETAKRIREFSETYLLFLTARSDEIDTVQGLQSGADDYLTKPFRPRELRARIEAMLRRPRGIVTAGSDAAPAPNDSEAGWFEHRGLRLHSDMRIVTIDGEDIVLTRSEFDILADLLRAGRRVISKQELAILLRGDRGTGSDYVSDHDARTIEVHIANLRRKLGDSPSQPRWIETVRGVGYRLTA